MPVTDTGSPPDEPATTSGSAKGRALLNKLPQLAHIVLYGQSLSVGFMGIPVLSTTPQPLGYRFAGGVRSLDAIYRTDGGESALQTLEALNETEFRMFGETPATACVSMIAQLLERENGLVPQDMPFRFMVTAPGANAVSARELCDPNCFEHVKIGSLYGAQRARDLGLGYGLVALGWIQGEADTESGTSREDYKRLVRRVHGLVSSITTGMNPRAAQPPMLLTQVVTHPASKVSSPEIALAQLELADDENAALICVPYALPFWPNDQHMSAAGYQWLGAYYGLAIKRWLCDGVKPSHIRPRHANLSGDTIELSFDSPNGKLVLDTTTVPEQEAYGFAVVKADGEKVPIRSARLAGPSTVALQVDAVSKMDMSVRYAWSGDAMKGLGNLRDDLGETIAFEADGYSLPLHSWAPIFELAVTASGS